MGRKLGGGSAPLWERGAGSPSNTMWPGPRPTCMPSFILIRPIIPFDHNTPTLQSDRQTDETDRTDRKRSDSISHSDDFEGQGQRSRSPGTKTRLALLSRTGNVRMVCARCKCARCQHRPAAADNTIRSLPGGDFGGFSWGVCL